MTARLHVLLLALVCCLSTVACHQQQLQQLQANNEDNNDIVNKQAEVRADNKFERRNANQQTLADHRLIMQQPSQQPQTPISHSKLAAKAKKAAAVKQRGSKGAKRLSGKIKGASNTRRQRRRQQRHQRRGQRAHAHHRFGAKSAALLAASAGAAAAAVANTAESAAHSVAQPTSAALAALESIVEEVARAGQQLPTVSVPAVVGPLAGQTFQVGGDLMLAGASDALAPLPTVKSALGNVANAMGGAGAGHGLVQPSQQQHQPNLLLTSMLSKIMNVLNVTEFALEMRDGISSRASCMACNAVVGLFLSPLYSKDVFSAAIRTVCTSFKIQSPRVCSGLVEAFQDDFEYIRKNTKLTRDEICAVVFGTDCARRQTYNLYWTVPIPDYPSSSLEHGNDLQPFNSNSVPQTNGNNQNLNIEFGDAPDMNNFEYRKLSATTQHPSQQETQQPSLTSSTLSTSATTRDASTREGKAQSSNQRLQQRALRQRPQYIFDDGFATSNGGKGPSQNQASMLPGKIKTNSNNNNRRGKLSSFVQITDIHIDPYYEEGSLNDCHEALCCRATSGIVQHNDKRRQAGRWGDYGNCDTPVRTLKSALERIRAKHSDAEYWLWTGDISPHDIWNITKSETISHAKLVSRMIREYSNVPVFPVIGNHEAHPVNSFSPPEIKDPKFSMSWLYDALADEWSQWLPNDAIKTLRIGGYYKLRIRPGFRIISVNTNYCARLNPWSFYDPVDPANQLRWLASELLEAEMNNDKVHIIGHVPPDNRECTQAWLYNFINIVDRFKDTIQAQFYGHTHRDEFRVMYSMKNQDEPVGIQYIGPSITPFTENNPAYRIYHQDQSGSLFDFETYFFNLTEANNAPPNVDPYWKFAYRVQESLNMTTSLTPREWNIYVQKLYENEDLFDVFYQNFYRSSDVKADTICRNKCKYTILSDLRLLHPYKTKPKPFLANRKTSNHNKNDNQNQSSHNHRLHNHNHRRHNHRNNIG